MFTTGFFIRNRAVCETMCENVVEAGRPQMTIWQLRIASYILKATNTLSAYVIRITFPLQQWLHERSLRSLPVRLETLFE